MSAAPGLVTDWNGMIASDGGWALIADGLGGHSAGEVASALALEILRPVMGRLRTDRDVAAAIRSADSALYLAMEQRPDLEGMGTTIAGAVLRGAEALLFNVGDSRIYLLRGGTLTRASTDDVVGSHQLTQCLGGSQVQVELYPHVLQCPFDPGDRLLLCSDGLSDMVADETIASMLSNAENPAEALVEAALDAGGRDNISVTALI